MKICRKCKKHVTNKAKICKYCGADVSKAKIIKNSVPTKKKNSNHPVVKNKINVEKQEKKIEGKVELKKDNKKEQVKEAVSKNQKFSSVINVCKVIFEKVKVLLIWLYHALIKVVNMIKISTIKLISMIGPVLVKIKVGLIKLFKLLRVMVIKVVKVLVVVSSFIAKLFVKLRLIIKEKRAKSSIKRAAKKEIKEEKTTKKQEKRELKRNYLDEKRRVIREVKEEKKQAKQAKLIKKQEVVANIKEQEIDNQENEEVSHKFKWSFLVIFVCIISILSMGYYFKDDIYSSLTGTKKAIVISEKATKSKVFSMDEIINYNGVEYKVVSVTTSKGNSYKSPKDGNQFLIVTIYIKNDTGEKIKYNYANWTMSNSKGEENKRIFTSINVDNALYSGDLVIGGIKTGSMVFEEPIGDQDLRLNYYDLKKDENGDYIADKSKRIFSVSIKVNKDTIEKKSDKKVLKSDSNDK